MSDFLEAENFLINILFIVHIYRSQIAANRKRKMHRKWFNVLKTLSVIFFVLLINTNYLTFAQEISNEGIDNDSENYQIQQPEESKVAKRGWSQLQGSWGKRSLNDFTERNFRNPEMNVEYPDRLIIRSYDYEYEPTRFAGLISDSDDFDELQPVEKRAWNSMNGAWGKRNWNKLRGTGKREPGNWNNLRGLWGKRSNDLRSWKKLSPSWGK